MILHLILLLQKMSQSQHQYIGLKYNLYSLQPNCEKLCPSGCIFKFMKWVRSNRWIPETKNCSLCSCEPFNFTANKLQHPITFQTIVKWGQIKNSWFSISPAPYFLILNTSLNKNAQGCKRLHEAALVCIRLPKAN